MKRIHAALAAAALAAFLPCASAKAQSAKEMTAYFAATLRGGTPAPKGKSVSAAKAAEAQKKVWKAWAEANKASRDSLWPEAAPLAEGRAHRWLLPAEQESVTVMPFYYGTKGEKPAAGWPLFLYLHGSGPKEAEWKTGLALAQRFADAPSSYLIPQIPNEGPWYRWYQRSKQEAWERMLRLALLDPATDPARLYVFGISEGGYGSQRLASFYADYWAAAGPMAGGEPLVNAPAENLAHTPLSLLTGERDHGFYREKLTRYTRAALDSLTALAPGSYTHRIELQPGRGHAIDYSPTTPWLARFRRTAQPRAFSWEDYEMDGRRRQGFYNIEVLSRRDSTVRQRYDLVCDSAANAVRLTVRDVAYTVTERDSLYGISLKCARTDTEPAGVRLRLYLSDSLVCLSRPVRVYVNGSLAYEGTLSRSTEAMQRSVALFHDPLRIFTAAIEVEAGKP